MKHLRILSSLFFSFVLAASLALPVPALAQASSSSTASSQSAVTALSSSSSVVASVADSAVADSSSVSASSATTAEEKSAAAASIASSSSVNESQEGTSYKEGEVIVVFKDSADSTSAKETLADAATVKAGQAEEKTIIADDIVVAKVTDGVTVSQAVNELSKDPDVAIVQPNYRYTLMEDESSSTTASSADSTITAQSTSINDPKASLQWQLNGTYGVNCSQAWDYARADGSLNGETAVGVAVIDTGCLTTHEDLADNICGAYNSVSKISGNSAVTDTVGHGTHVAGIIAARSDNGLGGSGVSYNAKIVPIKAISSDGYFYSDGLVSAYDYLINNASTYNIKVVNMSLGGGIDSESDITSDDALLSKVDEAYKAGILTVCAAGNIDSANNFYPPFYEYPGDYATCLSVINVDSSGSRSDSSNYNTNDVSESSANGTKDISAPGTSILSTYINSNSSYGYMTGTSMASPVVAGVAALVFSANSSLTPEQVKRILESTSTDLGTSGWDREYGYGEVNALSAVDLALSADLADDTISIASSQTYTGSALTPKPTITTHVGKVLTEGTDYTLSYSANTNVGTATVTALGTGNYTGSASTTFAIVDSDISVSLTTHVQDYGWQSAVTSMPSSIATSGTTGQSLRLEAIKMTLGSTPYSGSISYSAHVQDVGWQGWVSDGALAGTTGQSLRLEAIRIKLTGDLSNYYDVYYRVHAENIGWMDWACNGEEAGTAGYSYRLEALQVVIVKKGETPASTSPPRATAEHFESLKYRTHVQDVGWMDWTKEGALSGTSGRSLRLEGINVSLGTGEYSGSINYRTQVQNIGWQGWKSDGELAGTSGRSLRLEAIQITLSGEMANHYDVYYRVHVQNIGWQGWVSDGATAGTVGKSLRLEAIQIKLVPK